MPLPSFPYESFLMCQRLIRLDVSYQKKKKDNPNGLKAPFALKSMRFGKKRENELFGFVAYKSGRTLPYLVET